MALFKRSLSDDEDFQHLVALLDEDLKIRDGDKHSFYAPFNKFDTICNVIIYYADNEPIACGAIKEFNEQEAEIKRMFVRPEYRGRGIGLDLLQKLELWASELNYTECILETGKNQPEAIRLYQRGGYTLIKNYGVYENDEDSVCMTKAIL